MTQLQQLIDTLCDADHATIETHQPAALSLRQISNIVCTCEELALAAEEEYLDRWAQAVFTLFDPYDYHLYRVTHETEKYVCAECKRAVKYPFYIAPTPLCCDCASIAYNATT